MQISQLLKVQIQKFLCLSYREFPEFSRTHLTLICKSILNASRSLQTKRTCYLTGLVYVSISEKCFDEMKTETYCTSAGCMQWRALQHSACSICRWVAGLRCLQQCRRDALSVACSGCCTSLDIGLTAVGAACPLQALQAAVSRDQYC